MNYLDEISWNIGTEPNTATIPVEKILDIVPNANIDEEGEEFSEDDYPLPLELLTLPVFAECPRIDPCQPVYIVLPTHRFSKAFVAITVPSQITVGELLDNIYHFYTTQPLTKSNLSKIPDTCWGYRKKASEDLKNGIQVYAIELMGAMRHFEGFSISDDNKGFLQLGS